MFSTGGRVVKSGKKHRTKAVVQAPFVLESKTKPAGNATNLHSKPLLLRNALASTNLRPRTSQRQRSTARKGVNLQRAQPTKKTSLHSL